MAPGQTRYAESVIRATLKRSDPAPSPRTKSHPLIPFLRNHSPCYNLPMTQIATNILKYTAIFNPAPEGGYTVTIPQLPGCISEGDNFAEALTNIREAIELYLDELPQEDPLWDSEPLELFTVPVEIQMKAR